MFKEGNVILSVKFVYKEYLLRFVFRFVGAVYFVFIYYFIKVVYKLYIILFYIIRGAVVFIFCYFLVS